MLQKEIESALLSYHDPYLDQTLDTCRVVKRVAVTASEVAIELCYGYPTKNSEKKITADIEQLLVTLLGSRMLKLTIRSQIQSHAGKQGIPALPNIKNIIAIGSGKGGVGKSLVANHAAIALAQAGARVGLLDADIYGPSQPAMLGASGAKPQVKEGKLIPLSRYGIQSMSIGYLVDQQAAIVWRGPMLGKAIQQMLIDTQWDALDYLLIDLPPGTGDVQLTLCQKMPLTAAVMITTPQEMALLDVRRACEMFHKMNVPLLGIIENMSRYRCSHCGQDAFIFSEGGGERLASEYHLPLLGSIPLHLPLREMTDQGEVQQCQTNHPEVGELFKHIALRMAAKLSLQHRDYSNLFPKIVVKNG